MISTILEGMVLGFGASVPIGPINILIMSYALKSYKQAVALGLGSMSADIIYLLLLTTGLLQVFKHEWVQKGLSIFGFIFLIVIGIMLFRTKGRHLKMNKKVRNSHVVLIYIKGLLLTMLNPYTVGFWLSIASLVASKDFVNIKPLLIGLVVAIFSWVTLMPLMVHKNKHFVSEKVAYYFSIIAGIILIVFAFVLLHNTFIAETKWI